MSEILSPISKSNFEQTLETKMGKGKPPYDGRFYSQEWSRNPINQITWEYCVRLQDNSGLLAIYDQRNPRLRTNLIFIEMSPRDVTKATSIQAWVHDQSDPSKYYSFIYQGEGITERHLALQEITRMRSYSSGLNGSDRKWNKDSHSELFKQELLEEINQATGTERSYLNADWYGLFSFYSKQENITKENCEAILKNPLYPF